MDGHAAPGEVRRDPAHFEEAITFLSASPILGQLNRCNLERIASALVSARYDPGQLVFKKGEVARSVFIVRTGLLQVQRTDLQTGRSKAFAHFAPGQVLCDIGVFSGVEHRSSARAAEATEIWYVTWLRLQELVREFPELGIQLCQALSQSLTTTKTSLESHTNTKVSLSGALDRINLVAVIQTLTASDCLSGLLRVHTGRGKVGEVLFWRGRITDSTFTGLRGELAFRELVIEAADEGSFTFEEIDPETKAVESLRLSQTAIDVPTPMLLMDAIRGRDEYLRFRDRVFPVPSARPVATGKRPNFPGVDSAYARRIWTDIQRGQTVAEILGDTSALKRLAVYQVLQSFLEDGAIVMPGGSVGVDQKPPGSNRPSRIAPGSPGRSGARPPSRG
jgi:CRP-like cAMP-binding protein